MTNYHEKNNIKQVKCFKNETYVTHICICHNIFVVNYVMSVYTD